MKRPIERFAGVCVLLLPVLAQAEVVGSCERSFATGFAAGGRLTIHVRPGDIDVVGSDQTGIRVSCAVMNTDRARNVKIRFLGSGSGGELRINGGRNDDARFRIEVPRRSDLFVRSAAGDLRVKDVEGSKDVELLAGDLTITVGNAKDYRHADASVVAGDLTASAFGVTKDGLFRSFHKDFQTGKYNLHARLLAGNLVLQ